jgi:hypothetical protein
MVLLLKSFLLSTAMIWLMQPKQATWMIGTMDWPWLYPTVDSWWGGVLPFGLQWDAWVTGKAVVHNPNRAGAYMHDAQLDIYARLSDYRLRYLGVVNASEARIHGRSDTYIDTTLRLESLDLSFLADIMSTMAGNNWQVPILALGTASVDSFTMLTVGIKCKAVIEINLLAAPYAQVYSAHDPTDPDHTCHFTYNLQAPPAENGVAPRPRMPPKFLYDRLPRVPLLARFPKLDLDWL